MFFVDVEKLNDILRTSENTEVDEDDDIDEHQFNEEDCHNPIFYPNFLTVFEKKSKTNKKTNNLKYIFSMYLCCFLHVQRPSKRSKNLKIYFRCIWFLTRLFKKLLINFIKSMLTLYFFINIKYKK